MIKIWTYSEGLEYISNEKDERRLQPVLKMGCFIVNWCFWKI